MSAKGTMMYIFKGAMQLTDERHETNLWYFSTRKKPSLKLKLFKFIKARH